MKVFKIINSTNDRHDGKVFTLSDTSIKTLCSLREFSHKDLKIVMFDGQHIRIINEHVTIEAKLLRKS